MNSSANRVGIWLGLAASTFCSISEAHHSGAMFDMEHCVTLDGTVRSLEWSYPHVWVWAEVPGKEGANAVWGFEGPSPTQLEHIDAHWSKEILSKGDKVRITFGPLKDGRNGGAMARVKLPDGRVLIGSPGLCGTSADPEATSKGAQSK